MYDLPSVSLQHREGNVDVWAMGSLMLSHACLGLGCIEMKYTHAIYIVE